MIRSGAEGCEGCVRFGLLSCTLNGEILFLNIAKLCVRNRVRQNQLPNLVDLFGRCFPHTTEQGKVYHSCFSVIRHFWTVRTLSISYVWGYILKVICVAIQKINRFSSTLNLALNRGMSDSEESPIKLLQEQMKLLTESIEKLTKVIHSHNHPKPQPQPQPQPQPLPHRNPNPNSKPS